MAEESDDEGTSGLPPHPLDRVWFHPSELGAPREPLPAPARRRVWGVAFVGAICGVVATLGLVAATGGLDNSTDGNGSSSALVPVFAQLQGDRAADLVNEAGGSVVSVRTQGDAGESGSGVALGGERILTSAALIQGATVVSITTSHGRVLTAMVAGVDAVTDLALLRLDGARAHVPAARLGSTDGLEVGTWVLALGAAGGERRWASQGVVSGLGVVVPRVDGTMMAGMVATDVAPHTAAGGGVLLDDDGAVVAILVRAAPAHALPIEVAREVAEQLNASGRVRHPWLGVDCVDAAERGGGGALVQVVSAGSPAEAAGILQGDVIIGFGDDRVADLADLLESVARRRPGDPVELTVWRGDDRIHRRATLAERQ